MEEQRNPLMGSWIQQPCWEAVESRRWDLHGGTISWVLCFAWSPSYIPIFLFSASCPPWVAHPGPPNPLRHDKLTLGNPCSFESSGWGTWSQWRERQVTKPGTKARGGVGSRIAFLVCLGGGVLSRSFTDLLLTPPPATPVPCSPDPSPAVSIVPCLGKANLSFSLLGQRETLLIQSIQLWKEEKPAIKTTHRHITRLHHLAKPLLASGSLKEKHITDTPSRPPGCPPRVFSSPQIPHSPERSMFMQSDFISSIHILIDLLFFAIYAMHP